MLCGTEYGPATTFAHGNNTSGRFSSRTSFHGVKWIGVGLADKNTALSKLSFRLRTRVQTGKYELRPAVKKLYQLRPKLTASSVSVASRG